jgi:hypothetical protein
LARAADVTDLTLCVGRGDAEPPSLRPTTDAASETSQSASVGGEPEQLRHQFQQQSPVRQHQQLLPRLVYVGRPLSPERFLSAGAAVGADCGRDAVTSLLDDDGTRLLQLATGSTAANGNDNDPQQLVHGRWAARSLSLPAANAPSSFCCLRCPVVASSSSPSSSLIMTSSSDDAAAMTSSPLRYATVAATTTDAVPSTDGGCGTSSAPDADKFNFLRLPSLHCGSHVISGSSSDDMELPRRRHSVAASLLASRQLEAIAEEGAAGGSGGSGAAAGGLLQAKGSIRRHSIQEQTSKTSAIDF